MTVAPVSLDNPEDRAVFLPALRVATETLDARIATLDEDSDEQWDAVMQQGEFAGRYCDLLAPTFAELEVLTEDGSEAIAAAAVIRFSDWDNYSNAS